MKYIASAQNESLKHLAKLLAQAKARRQHGQTVLEGVHLLDAYLHSGHSPQQVYVPEPRLAHAEVQALLACLPSAAVTVVQATALGKISSLTQADELMSLVATPSPECLPQQGDCVVLERLQDPGNVGTILRSAAAAGVRQVLCSADSVDVWSPKVLRAGMGAHFLLQLHTDVDVLAFAQGFSGKLWVTALQPDQHASLYDLDLRTPAAWVFGNEGAGVSAAVQQAASRCVLIPMSGATESLNVAMAATVCLFEQMRQRLNK